MPHVSFRQARTFLAACEHSSVSGAAKSINRSQSSVTKSLQELERALDTDLFDRSSKGVSLTAFGKVLEIGASKASETLAAASGLLPPVFMRSSPSVSRFFQMDVSDKWLAAFLATAEHQNLAGAAEQLGITPAAVSSNVRKLEDTLNTTLFERLPTATVPTVFARELVRHVKLAQSHLRHACDDIAQTKGVKSGRVSVGSLPFVRTLILPKAIAAMRAEHPEIDVSTLEGPYEDLVAALRCGDIDFIVGALRDQLQDSGLHEEALLDDELSVIVRSGHPLQRRQTIDWPDLLDYEWILPRHGTPTRELFEQALEAQGLHCPSHVVETSSSLLLRGLLIESEQITVLSRHQIYYDEAHGMLAVLPFELPGTRRPIGITTRANSSMAPAARLLIDAIKEVSSTLEGPP